MDDLPFDNLVERALDKFPFGSVRRDETGFVVVFYKVIVIFPEAFSQAAEELFQAIPRQFGFAGYVCGVEN